MSANVLSYGISGVPRGWVGMLAALIPLIVLAAAFEVFCLLDVARAAEVRYLPKWAWAIVCLISVPVGGIIYLVLGRVR